jgi:hypothetical protein
MGTKGSFGYKIGRKIRLMHVQYDADLLWQVCVREIYILMKYYGSIELLRDAFEKLQDAKNKPTKYAIEKCKPYTDLTLSTQSIHDWYCLTRNCQHSFINILDSGYFLNSGMNSGIILLLDFNTNLIRFYCVNSDKTEDEYEKATINEIMDFDEMPTKSYSEIITDTKDRYENYSDKIKKLDDQTERINILIKKAKEIGATEDMIRQSKTLLYEIQHQRTKLEREYRYFYHRLDALNLIDHTST